MWAGMEGRLRGDGRRAGGQDWMMGRMGAWTEDGRSDGTGECVGQVLRMEGGVGVGTGNGTGLG